MKDLRELKERIEGVDMSSYDYDAIYCDLSNLCIDYMNNTQNWIFEDVLNQYVTYDMVEEMAKSELETGGLVRLYYFMGNANFNNDLFYINGYGNCEDVTMDDLKTLQEEIIDIIDYEMEEENNEEE